MPPSPYLPTTPRAWETIVNKPEFHSSVKAGANAIAIRAHASNSSISGSKMTLADLLALRVLFVEQTPKELENDMAKMFDSTVKAQATKAAQDHKPLTQYVTHHKAGDSAHPFLVKGAAFTLVDHFFRKVLNLNSKDGEDSSHIWVAQTRSMASRAAEYGYNPASPGAQRHSQLVEHEYGDYMSTTPENSVDLPMRDRSSPLSVRDKTPSLSSSLRSELVGNTRKGHKPSDSMSSRVSDQSMYDQSFSSATSSKVSKGSRYSPSVASAMDSTHEPLEPEFHRATAGEQVVNIALITLVSSLTLGIAQVKAVWSVDQEHLKLGSGLNARTDGSLRATWGKKHVAALIECKARVRKACKPDVQFQEAAQMAAWIHQERTGDFNTPLTAKDGKRRRVSVCMNHCEIYIIVAEFKQGYVDYLDNTAKDEGTTPHPITDDSFMTMRSYGPFVSNNYAALKCIVLFLLHLTFAQSLEFAPSYESESDSGSESGSGSGSDTDTE